MLPIQVERLKLSINGLPISCRLIIFTSLPTSSSKSAFEIADTLWADISRWRSNSIRMLANGVRDIAIIYVAIIAAYTRAFVEGRSARTENGRTPRLIEYRQDLQSLIAISHFEKTLLTTIHIYIILPQENIWDDLVQIQKKKLDSASLYTKDDQQRDQLLLSKILRIFWWSSVMGMISKG